MATVVEENLEVSVEPNHGWDSRIKCIKCGDLVRSYLIKTKRFVLVYDTLLGPKSGGFLREQALMFADGTPLVVVNSHADWDHYFGNMMFPEMILGSQLMVKRVTGQVGQKELEEKRREHPESYDSVSLCAPTVGLSSNATLYGGDLTLQLFHTKGHRPDHLSLFIPEISILFPGDCVEDPIPLVDEDSDEKSQTLDELIDSLHHFLRLKPEWVLANHAEPERGVDRIKNNLRYLENLRHTARGAESLEQLHELLPAQESWGKFYQTARSNQVGMAWQQTRSMAEKWAED